MPFKIVKTIEDGEDKLCIIPSQWENKGILKYPEKTSDYKLYRDANSKPGRDWPTMRCQVKRTAIFTYKQANDVLKEMSQTSDTDSVNDRPKNKESDNDKAANNYNVLAEHLIFNRHPDEGTSSNAAVEPLSVEYDFVSPTVNTAPVIIASGVQQRNDNTQILELLRANENLLLTVLQVCNASLENQALLAEKVDALSDSQKKMTHKVLSLSAQMDDGFSNIGKMIRESAAVVPLGLSNPDERSSFELKPVDSVEDLENLELFLSDKTQKSKLTKLYSILCTTAVGNGGTCAYKLLDIMFSREFICKCSWSGGSRGKDLKVGLKGYQNVLNFFFAMVHSWDPIFTLEDTERFFKIVLKNSLKRKENKNIRASTKRRVTLKRVKRSKIIKTVEKAVNNNETDSSEETSKIECKKNELTKCVQGHKVKESVQMRSDMNTKEIIIEKTESKSEDKRGQLARTPKNQEDTENKEIIREKKEYPVPGTSRENAIFLYEKRNGSRRESSEKSFDEPEEEERKEQISDNMTKRKSVLTDKLQKKQLKEDEKYIEESSFESEEQEKKEQTSENMIKLKKIVTNKVQKKHDVDEKYMEESSNESEEEEKKQISENMRKRKHQKVVTNKEKLNGDKKYIGESSYESQEENKEEQTRENMRKRKKVVTQKIQLHEGDAGCDKNKYKKETTKNEKSLTRREQEEGEENKDDKTTESNKKSKFEECEQTRRNLPYEGSVENEEVENCKDNGGETGRKLKKEGRIKIVEDILVLKKSK